jgi:hypothetical protein
VLVIKALTFMPICASCQSKRRGIHHRTKQLLPLRGCALACGLALHSIVSWLPRLLLSAHHLNTQLLSSVPVGAIYSSTAVKTAWFPKWGFL